MLHISWTFYLISHSRHPFTVTCNLSPTASTIHFSHPNPFHHNRPFTLLSPSISPIPHVIRSPSLATCLLCIRIIHFSRPNSSYHYLSSTFLSSFMLPTPHAIRSTPSIMYQYPHSSFTPQVLLPVSLIRPALSAALSRRLHQPRADSQSSAALKTRKT